MTSPVESSMADDDLSRQRRNLEARLLDRPVPNFPALTVADVLAKSDEGHAALDAPSYLAERVERCHTWTTIEKVVAYLQRPRPGLPDPAGAAVRPLPRRRARRARWSHARCCDAQR